MRNVVQRLMTRVLPTSMMVLGILLGTVQRCASQNMGFTPGDAFFVFDLTEEFVRQLPKAGGTVNLFYATPLINLGGYAGFDKMRLEGVTPSLVRNLRRAYEDHRRYTPKIVRLRQLENGAEAGTELNSPIAFVYNADADWKQQRIALKYNEDWPQLPADAFAGSNRKMFFAGKELYNRAEVYQPLVRTYDAVTEDWQNARRFPPLKVEVPQDVGWGRTDHTSVTEPVVAQCNDVQFVIITHEVLEDYFLRMPGISFYQVTSDIIRRCEWQLGEEGIELIKRDLTAEEVSRSPETKQTLPRRYHGYVYYRMVREDLRNGDITTPVWPDCRIPIGMAGWLDQIIGLAEDSVETNVPRE